MFRVETEEMETQGGEGGTRPVHLPVLPAEIVEVFRGLPEALSTGWIVDATLGLGGHTELLLESLPSIRVLGVDQDPQAIELAKDRLERFGRRVRLRRARFSELSRLIRKEHTAPVVGMLFDLGVSSMQLDVAERGFSFQADGPLDMRMDPARDRTAAQIVNHWDESDLADLFFYEGGETRARRIARAIVEARRRAPFLRTAALADVIANAMGGEGMGRLHPATKAFQALRRAVNEEGEELCAALSAAEHWLVDGGRMAAIAFHSGEDGEVKRFLSAGARDRRFKLTNKKPLEASLAERRTNPRSRSAKLRVAERMRPIANDPHSLHAEGGSP
jgi:16S rRNA (cytosine1402-N4)-methyltransferase